MTTILGGIHESSIVLREKGSNFALFRLKFGWMHEVALVVFAYRYNICTQLFNKSLSKPVRVQDCCSVSEIDDTIDIVSIS